MSDDPHMALAIELYRAWARSRQLTTTWHDLRPDDVKHWRHVAAAALTWMEERVESEE